MDVSSVGAAVAAGLLSGGGAGYLVSIYTARKESEDRKEALRLERQKFQHERDKWQATQSQESQRFRLAKLNETETLLLLIDEVFNRLSMMESDDELLLAIDDDLEQRTNATLARTQLLIVELRALGYVELHTKMLRASTVLTYVMEKEKLPNQKIRDKFNEMMKEALEVLTASRLELISPTVSV